MLPLDSPELYSCNRKTAKSAWVIKNPRKSYLSWIPCFFSLRGFKSGLFKIVSPWGATGVTLRRNSFLFIKIICGIF